MNVKLKIILDESNKSLIIKMLIFLVFDRQLKNAFLPKIVSQKSIFLEKSKLKCIPNIIDKLPQSINEQSDT